MLNKHYLGGVGDKACDHEGEIGFQFRKSQT